MKENFMKEIEYLENKLLSVWYDENIFNVYVSENKIVFGSLGNEASIFSKIIEFKTLYDTLIDLNWKIQLSFSEAIKYSYSDAVYNNFSITKSSKEEKLAYYNIENALFRTITVWDILAQLYCIFYSVNIKKHNINYKRIFNHTKNEFSKDFYEKAKEINSYIEENSDTELDEELKGNHKFLSDFRNQMIHRNAPSISTISNFDFNIKSHPVYILKRAIEDYVVAHKYVVEIIDEVLLQYKIK